MSCYGLSRTVTLRNRSMCFSSVLGIELLQYVFVMKFTLVDGTGALNAYLFDYVSNSRLRQTIQVMWVWILFVFKIANVCTKIFVPCYLQCFVGTVTSAVILLIVSIS